MEEDKFYTDFFNALNIGGPKMDYTAILYLARNASSLHEQSIIIPWLGYIKSLVKYRDFILLLDSTDKWEEAWIDSFARHPYVGRNKYLRSTYCLLK